jgi:antitoxin (DNA-binding transcriptional repressor) of toxin-antitoxin stability system
METISVSSLKSHLSAELKKVQRGAPLVVVDHRKPIAVLSGFQGESLYLREAEAPYAYSECAPLMDGDLDRIIRDDRADSW